MAEELFKAQYDVTKKSKIEKFYINNKKLIYSSIIILILLLGSFSFYLENKENKKILLSENYMKARIFLKDGNKIGATDILKKIIFNNDSTYSVLSLLLIVNENLAINNEDLLSLFNHVLSNNKLTSEVESLLIYKKTLLKSDSINEKEILESLKPLLNDKNFWRPHALLLIGDYFVSKKENIKAIEFYQKIFTINNLHNDLYNHARSQLAVISNE